MGFYIACIKRKNTLKDIMRRKLFPVKSNSFTQGNTCESKVKKQEVGDDLSVCVLKLEFVWEKI